MMRRRPTAEELLVKMAGLCSRSEQCEGDIVAKLLRAGLTRGAADGVVDELKGRGFIDEARYARAFARDKVHTLVCMGGDGARYAWRWLPNA